MSETRIVVSSLKVEYREYSSASRSIKTNFLSGKTSSAKTTRSAVEDISLTVSAGEVLGVIGRNGAGKSTLVKAICGVVKPTNGFVQTFGTLTPMIELGAGINLEFNARENVTLHSALYGIPHEKDEERTRQILEWAGLEYSSEKPLKSYSSGMLARFSFALSTQIQPDILVLDEILSVGDQEFQNKSLERTKQLMGEGCAVVLVSHSMPTILEFATSVVWLNGGRVIQSGDPKEVVAEYQGHFSV